MTNYYAEITGWGKCVPPTVLSNDDLSTFLDTSDEWIRTRTGIENRRISHVNTSDMATVAAQHALARAGVEASEIDLIIVATCSPDSLIPNIASKVQQNLGIRSAAAFDLNAACTGFVYGLETGTRLIQSGNYRHAIIIGAERLSFYIDWAMRDTAVLFGDGAGAWFYLAQRKKRACCNRKLVVMPKVAIFFLCRSLALVWTALRKITVTGISTLWVKRSSNAQ